MSLVSPAFSCVRRDRSHSGYDHCRPLRLRVGRGRPSSSTDSVGHAVVRGSGNGRPHDAGAWTGRHGCLRAVIRDCSDGSRSVGRREAVNRIRRMGSFGRSFPTRFPRYATGFKTGWTATAFSVPRGRCASWACISGRRDRLGNRCTFERTPLVDSVGRVDGSGWCCCSAGDAPFWAKRDLFRSQGRFR